MDYEFLLCPSEYRRNKPGYLRAVWCMCKRCIDPGCDDLRALSCMQCGRARCRPKLLEPAQGELGGMLWRCAACGFRASGTQGMPYFIAEQDALQYLPHNVTASSEIKDLSVPAMQYSLAKILEKVRTNHYIAQLMRHLEVKYCHLTNADTTPLLADVFFHFEWLVINFRGSHRPFNSLYDFDRSQLQPGLQIKDMWPLCRGVARLVDYASGESAREAKLAIDKARSQGITSCCARTCLYRANLDQPKSQRVPCRGCRCIFYCTTECEEAHQTQHRYACAQNESVQQMIEHKRSLLMLMRCPNVS